MCHHFATDICGYKKVVAFLCLLLLQAGSVFAQMSSIPADRQKMATAEIIKVGSGKSADKYLNYHVDTQSFMAAVFPEYDMDVIGSRYIIAYDSLEPDLYDVLNFSRPFFSGNEDTSSTAGKIVQTNFGGAVKYGTNGYDWIKYVFFAPVPGKNKLKIRSYTGYRFFNQRAPADTNLQAGRLFHVTYLTGDPGRSILHINEPIKDTVPYITPELQRYRNRVVYKEVGVFGGLTVVPCLANYSNFQFHFTDAGSGAGLNRKYSIPASINNYCLTLGLVAFRNYHKHYISELIPLNFILGWSARGTFFGQLDIAKGYQVQLTKQATYDHYRLYPAVKAGLAMHLGGNLLSYKLGKLQSTNDNNIIVNGNELGNKVKVSYQRTGFMLAPEASMHVRFSEAIELKLSCMYNITIAVDEGIKFTYDEDSQKPEAIRDFVSDAANIPINNNLFRGIAPFIIKAEIGIF